MGKITLTNIAEELALRSGLSKDAADNFMRAIVDTIEKGLREDNIVKIKGLGTFKLMEVSDRGSIDVNTGERITIKGYTKVTFTPDSAMKEFVNRPFAHFEPTELNEGFQDEELIVDEEQSTTNTEELEEATGTSLLPAETASGENTDNTQETESQSAVENIESIEMETTINAEITDTSNIKTIGQKQKTKIVEENSTDLQSENVANPGVQPDNMDIAEEKEETATTITSETEEETKPEEKKTEETRAEEPKTEKPKSKRGCRAAGCLFGIFIILAAIVVGYFAVVPTIGKEEQNGQSEITVNPNLEGELDSKYNENSIKETEQTLSIVDSIQTGLITITEPSTNDTVSSVPETVQDQVIGENNTKNTDSQSNLELSESLVITKSLANKNIKDITLADTLDYAIEGTHTTHTLQSGETIIQLSRKYYGDKRLWPYIVKHNNIIDFDKVDVGMSISIPILMNRSAE